MESLDKNLKSDTHLLFINQVPKTSFPKKDNPNRKKIERIIADSRQYKYALSFDINKLSRAYDKNALPPELKQKLTPFTRTEDVIRVSTRKIKKYQDPYETTN